MRVMIKFALPVESGNTAIRTGKLQKVMQQIGEDLKPEAAYFFLHQQRDNVAASSSWTCRSRPRSWRWPNASSSG